MAPCLCWGDLFDGVSSCRPRLDDLRAVLDAGTDLSKLRAPGRCGGGSALDAVVAESASLHLAGEWEGCLSVARELASAGVPAVVPLRWSDIDVGSDLFSRRQGLLTAVAAMAAGRSQEVVSLRCPDTGRSPLDLLIDWVAEDAEGELRSELSTESILGAAELLAQSGASASQSIRRFRDDYLERLLRGDPCSNASLWDVLEVFSAAGLGMDLRRALGPEREALLLRQSLEFGSADGRLSHWPQGRLLFVENRLKSCNSFLTKMLAPIGGKVQVPGDVVGLVVSSLIGLQPQSPGAEGSDECKMAVVSGGTVESDEEVQFVPGPEVSKNGCVLCETSPL